MKRMIERIKRWTGLITILMVCSFWVAYGVMMEYATKAKAQPFMKEPMPLDTGACKVMAAPFGKDGIQVSRCGYTNDVCYVTSTGNISCREALYQLR